MSSIVRTVGTVFRRRRFLLQLSAASLIVYIAIVVSLGFRGDWAIDFTCCYQQAGQRLIEGRDLYEWSDTYTFRYTPWAALVFAIFAPFAEPVAVILWLAIKAAVLVMAAALFARAWRGPDRPLAFGLAAFFPPAMHDLMIGNVSSFTLAVEVVLIRLRPLLAGTAFGLLMLLVPKPHLVPVLLWLVVRQPRTGATAMAVGASGVALGIGVFGVDAWIGFFGTLREPLGREFTANIGLSGLMGPAGVVISALLAAGLFAMALMRRGTEGLGYAILAGIVLGPYTFIHYLVGVLVAAEPLLRERPRRLAAFPFLFLIAPLSHLWSVLLALVTWFTRNRPPENARA